jgi:hypothetical protein
MSASKPTPKVEDIPIKMLRANRDFIIAAMEKIEYPTPDCFRTVAEAAVSTLMVGLQLPGTRRMRRLIVDRISADAARKTSHPCRTWNSWLERLNRVSKEKEHRPAENDQSWLPGFLRQDNYKLGDDFTIFVGFGGGEFVLVGPRGKIVKKFNNAEELASLGLSLIDASTAVAIQTGSVVASRLDESVAESAIDHLNHLFRHGIKDGDCNCPPGEVN